MRIEGGWRWDQSLPSDLEGEESETAAAHCARAVGGGAGFQLLWSVVVGCGRLWSVVVGCGR